MPFLITALIILAVISAIYIAVLITLFINGVRRVMKEDTYEKEDLVARGLGKHADSIIEARNEFLSTDFETVEIQAFDGVTLRGLFKRTEKARGTIILFHGYRGSPDFDFCFSEKFYEEQGLNVLLPYQRAHGKSDGKYITFGIKERKDVHSWIEFINNKLDYQYKIVLSGLSMGATSVLMSAGQDYPENVKAIIADCGFTSPHAIFKHVVGHYTKLPFCILVHPFNFLCKLFAGFDIDDYSTTEALKCCKIPVFLVHGEADDFVPPEMTRENFAVISSEKKLLTVPGATHALSYVTDGDTYKRMIKEMLDSVL